MSDKVRVGILCGGRSSEHEISCISAQGVLTAIDRTEFEPMLIGITRSGRWVLPPADVRFEIRGETLPEISESWPEVQSSVGGFFCDGQRLLVDVVFPLLHGPYGEDGTVQGMLEMAGIRYVGSGVLASAVAMDKSFAKPIFAKAGLQVAEGSVVHHRDWQIDREEILTQLHTLPLPLFVKPSRGGSSRGTVKVKKIEDLSSAIEYAFEFDTKVMIEVAVVGKEIECAVLQSHGVAHASPLGQIVIVGNHEFYDFEAKYLDGSTRVDFPSDLPDGIADEIRSRAIAAFNALGCEGLARVDFFYADNGEIVINELNTMPGFTATSVYPKLWAHAGLSYSDLIAKLIHEAMWRSPSVTR